MRFVAQLQLQMFTHCTFKLNMLRDSGSSSSWYCSCSHAMSFHQGFAREDRQHRRQSSSGERGGTAAGMSLQRLWLATPSHVI
jgi:hypothetical protein